MCNNIAGRRCTLYTRLNERKPNVCLYVLLTRLLFIHKCLRAIYTHNIISEYIRLSPAFISVPSGGDRGLSPGDFLAVSSRPQLGEMPSALDRVRYVRCSPSTVLDTWTAGIYASEDNNSLTVRVLCNYRVWRWARLISGRVTDGRFLFLNSRSAVDADVVVHRNNISLPKIAAYDNGQSIIIKI